MSHIYILTITDQADFNRVIHTSAWHNRAQAEQHGVLVKYERLESDKHHFMDGLGDTYSATVEAVSMPSHVGAGGFIPSGFELLDGEVGRWRQAAEGPVWEPAEIALLSR